MREIAGSWGAARIQDIGEKGRAKGHSPPVGVLVISIAFLWKESVRSRLSSDGRSSCYDMYNPFDLESTDNNDNRNNRASLTGTHSDFVQHPPVPTFLPHVFPHPHPESFTSQSGSSSVPPINHQIYPFSPPATVHKGTAARGRRGRIVSRDLHLQSQPYPSSSQAGSQQSGSWKQLDDGRQNDSGWVLGNVEDGQGGDVPRTVGRRRVGRGRGRAVDCITG